MSVLPLPRTVIALAGDFVLPQAWDGQSPAPWLSFERLDLAPQSYVLELNSRGAHIGFADEAGRFYALQSLQQLLRQPGKGQLQAGARVPAQRLEDSPHFAVRGLSLDISRGRVPKRGTLLRFIDGLAELKLNQLQLYTEHTFAFKSQPLIGQGASPLTEADILAIDAHCAERHIELVPSLASFGHMSKVLSLEPYRHLAEDLGIGQYQKPDLDPEKLKEFEKGWTLSPVLEESYAFLDALYADYLPLFRSKRFNACCDETFDLGWGQSYALTQSVGLAEVFARHILRLRELAIAHGKTEMMIWSDVLRAHPIIMERLPKDVVVLDWVYGDNGDFSRFGEFGHAGFKAYACPSGNTWGTIFPRWPVSQANISGFAKAAVAQGADGFLNTVWGDHGHFNSPRLEWPGLGLGAELSWNPEAAAAGDFLPRFCRDFLGQAEPAFAQALADLGQQAAILGHGDMENFLTTAYLSAPDAEFFTRPGRAFYWADGDVIHREEKALGAEVCQRAVAVCRRVLPVLEEAFAKDDRRGVGPEHLWAVQGMSLGAEKWLELNEPRRQAQGRSGSLSPALKARLKRHRDSFEALWMAHDQRGDIAKTLARLDASL